MKFSLAVCCHATIACSFFGVTPVYPAAAAPEYRTVPAAATNELTPSNGWTGPEQGADWSRSLGGPTSNRFSTLDQITPDNVANLSVAWTYHSKDGAGNLQSNPIVVDGIMYAPTAGNFIVAVDAATGVERWRYKPEKKGNRLEDLPARRGLIYCRGDEANPPRLIFTAGNWIYALDPLNGKPIASFGTAGRTSLPTGGGVTGAVWKNVLVVPGFLGDVFGYDMITGKQLWRFRTMAAAEDFGGDTWEGRETGANCWGGMSMDESRGIAFVATGSPKPNLLALGIVGRTYFPTASSPWMPLRVGAYGISRKLPMTSGISICQRRPIWSR